MVQPAAAAQAGMAAAIFRDERADDEVEQIAVVRRQQPPRNNNNFNAASTRAPAANAAPIRSNGPHNPNIVCRYCKKKGHMQRECHSRRRDGCLLYTSDAADE